MQITVILHNGGRMEINVEPHERVGSMKEKIAELVNLEPANFKVIAQGRNLDEDQTLAEANLTEGSKVCVILHMRD
jgi:hypothetical protein